MKKEIGFIGLGRMGSNMTLNLLEKKWKVAVYNRSFEKTKKISKKGAVPVKTIKELCKKLKKPRFIWLMISAGKPVEETIKELKKYLEKGDTIIDGGNSFYEESIKRARKLSKKGINFPEELREQETEHL